ncbi:MAG: SulP family inorganic anion transporter [Hyphomicrobiaceae bacterium]
MNSEIAAENSAAADPTKTKTSNLSRASRQLLGDLFSGTVIATSNIALAVSFAAVIFQGELASGFTTGVWAMLMSMVVVGLIVGFLTSLQPIAGGPDTAVIAVLSLFATAIVAELSNTSASNADLVTHVMLGITLMTILGGVTIFLLGAMRWGQLLRFVPYPLIAGFLAATGLLLIASSPRIITDGSFQFEQVGDLFASQNQAKFGAMLGFAVLLASGRAIFKSPIVVPVVFLVRQQH